MTTKPSAWEQITGVLAIGAFGLSILSFKDSHQAFIDSHRALQQSDVSSRMDVAQHIYARMLYMRDPLLSDSRLPFRRAAKPQHELEAVIVVDNLGTTPVTQVMV